MDYSDREIYRAAIHGDRHAFETIIRGSSRALFAIAYGILQDRTEAEDVVQDAFVKAWSSRWRVRRPEKFPAWLATIARNRARDVARSRRTVPLTDELRGVADSAGDNRAMERRNADVNHGDCAGSGLLGFAPHLPIARCAAGERQYRVGKLSERSAVRSANDDRCVT